VATAIIGKELSSTAAGNLGYLDALVAVGSFMTTILTARKVVEGWWYWIVINILAVVLYTARGLDLVTIILYLTYAALSVRALLEWQQRLREGRAFAALP
jgi:nicotinamide mononucleotide transporter